MFKVELNGKELNLSFDKREQARKYVNSAKKVDKRYGEVHTYKVIETKGVNA